MYTNGLITIVYVIIMTRMQFACCSSFMSHGDGDGDGDWPCLGGTDVHSICMHLMQTHKAAVHSVGYGVTALVSVVCAQRREKI